MTLSDRTIRERLTHKPEDVAAQIGVGRNMIYTMIHSGRIRAIRVGRKLLIPRDAITDFLAGVK